MIASEIRQRYRGLQQGLKDDFRYQKLCYSNRNQTIVVALQRQEVNHLPTLVIPQRRKISSCSNDTSRYLIYYCARRSAFGYITRLERRKYDSIDLCSNNRGKSIVGARYHTSLQSSFQSSDISNTVEQIDIALAFAHELKDNTRRHLMFRQSGVPIIAT